MSPVLLLFTCHLIIGLTLAREKSSAQSDLQADLVSIKRETRKRERERKKERKVDTRALLIRPRVSILDTGSS